MQLLCAAVPLSTLYTGAFTTCSLEVHWAHLQGALHVQQVLQVGGAGGEAVARAEQQILLHAQGGMNDVVLRRGSPSKALLSADPCTHLIRLQTSNTGILG